MKGWGTGRLGGEGHFGAPRAWGAGALGISLPSLVGAGVSCVRSCRHIAW